MKESENNKLESLTIPATGGQAGTIDLRYLRAATALDRWLALQLARPLEEVSVALVLWDGSRIGNATTNYRVLIRDRATLWHLCLNPHLHFGDAYATGQLDVEGDLRGFLNAVYWHMQYGKRRLPGNWLRPWMNHARANTPQDSRFNISHHYNLGNDFYRLWLDAEMLYTCAYFPDPTLSLEEAQIAKMEHVCRKLRLRASDSVVEAGCGWGTLALYMARRYGVKVRAFNISEEQIRYARERARAGRLDDRVEFVLDDYRNITGQYDVFVSVGMLEHVGQAHYRELGSVIARSLVRNGRGLIHSIGRNSPDRINEWIERRIFPGAYPPTLREMMEVFEPGPLSVLDVENLRLHYAKTIEHWYERYQRHAEDIEAKYGQVFTRAWRLYLAGSIAAFDSGSLQLFQIVFTQAGNNALPWSRAHLYGASEDGHGTA